jgi:hypothetical protein
MNEIKVVHEDITDRDADFTTAKQLLHKAERIYLLGFGFGTTNVERLGLANLSPTGAFGGTAFRMSQKESGNCRTMSGGTCSFTPRSRVCSFFAKWPSLIRMASIRFLFKRSR